jgi:hypothetical protein
VNIMSDTVNRWAWFVLLALALALHLLFLARVPLSPSELPQALASLDAIRQVELSTASQSALLHLGNMLLFSLFGVGNGIARLIPALAGFALVCLPWYWRYRLGNTGALIAAGVLLFSPLVLFASRRVEGTTLSLLAAGALFTALAPVWNQNIREKYRDILITLGVSIGVLSGPAFYDMALAGIAAWFFWHWLQREKLDFEHYQSWMRSALTGLGVAILFSIGFGFRWSGWNDVMDGLAYWLSSWVVTSDASHLGALLLYEPLSLALAIVGVGYAWRKRASFQLALAVWALVVLLLVSLRGGAPVSSVGVAILACAYLAGYGGQNIIRDMPSSLTKWVFLHIGLGFVFLIPALLGLTQYAGGLVSADRPLLVLAGVIVLLAMQALLAFLFSLVLPVNVLWRSALLGISVMCLYIQTGFSLQLNFVRPTSPLEPAVMAAGSPDMMAFKQMIADIAIQRGLREDTLAITVVDSDAEITDSVRWTLRQYDRLQVSLVWPTETALSTTEYLVITPEGMDLSNVTTPGWKGMRFTVVSSYLAPTPGCRRMTTIDCTDWVKWYLYRTSPYPQSLKGLILWANF